MKLVVDDQPDQHQEEPLAVVRDQSSCEKSLMKFAAGSRRGDQVRIVTTRALGGELLKRVLGGRDRVRAIGGRLVFAPSCRRITSPSPAFAARRAICGALRRCGASRST